MKFPAVLAVLASLLSPCIHPMRAENWPQFRGPAGQGISSEKDAPLLWAKDRGVAWKIDVPGTGWSSPIVWKDRVYLTTVSDEVKARVLAIDRKTGKIIWDRHVFDIVLRRKEGKNSYATPTPCTDGNRIHAAFGDGGMAALDMSGEVAWTNRDVEFYSRHGLGSSPIVFEGKVIMPFDGSQRVDEAGSYPNNSAAEKLGWQTPWEKAELVALDAATGKRVWTGKRGLSRIGHTTPLILEIDGAAQIVSVAGDRIQGFAPATGERLWSFYAQGESPAPSPVAADGLLFAASGFEKTTLRALKLRGLHGDDIGESQLAWQTRKGVPTQASLLAFNGLLYAVTDGGILNCWKAATGDLLYQQRIGGNCSASPTAAAGRVYLLNEAGEMTVIAPEPAYRELAKNSLEGKFQASPAFSDGGIFLRSETQLWCIRKADE